ncbi:MAG: MFS transporter [Burkholderiales bacterium]
MLALATLTVMSTMVIAPAVPDIARAFEGAPNARAYSKLLLTMPALALIVFAPIAGWLVDRFGRLRLLVGALVLYGAAGLAGTVLNDLGWLIVSRAILGVAIAGTMTSMTALAGDYFHGEARARYSSLQSSVMSGAAVVAVMVAGLLAEIHWRFAFAPYALGWVVIVPVLLWLKEPPRHIANTARISDASTSIGPILAIYAITTFAVAMFYVTHVQTPFLARSVGVGSTTLIGVALALSSLLSAISATWYVRIRRHVGFMRMYALAFGLMAGGYALIAIAPSYPMILAGMFFSGIGVGFFYPNSSLGTLNLAPPALRGRVAGGLTASICLGQFVSPIVMEPAVAMTSVAGAFGIAALVIACVAIGCFFAQRRFGLLDA